MSKRAVFHNKVVNLIRDKGYKATTMRDIAAAMECDVSNVYNYLSSKQGFLEKVIFEMDHLFQTRMNEIMDSGLTPDRQLEEVIRMYVDFSINQPAEVGILLNEWRHLPPEKIIEFKSQKSKFEHKVKQILTSGIEDHSFKSMNIELATHLILSSLRLLFNHPVQGINPFNLQKEISTYILKGISSS